MKTILLILIISSVNLYSQTLVGYWPFSGSAADSSGNGNDGNLVNGVVLAYDRYSIANRSYLFNGSNSYIVGNSPGTNFPVGSTPRTITVWVKSNYLPSGDRNIFHYGTVGGGSPQNYHLFMRSPGLAGLGNGYSANWVIIAPENLGDTTWHFIAGVYEGPGTNMLRIYVDGFLNASGQPSNAPNTGTGTNWRMGVFLAGGQAFSGRMDEIRLYSGVLSATQVWDLYMQTTTTPSLISPPSGSQGNSLTPTLDWDSLTASTNYRVQIATDTLMTNIIWDTTVARSQVNMRAGLLSSNVVYWWRVRNNVNDELCPWSLRWSFRTALVGIQPISNEIPNQFSLSQNYPNPFNPVTKIQFSIPVGTGRDLSVRLIVYDVNGKEVSVLVNENKSAGNYSVEWDGTNFPSGVYFYRLTAGKVSIEKKMVLMK